MGDIIAPVVHVHRQHRFVHVHRQHRFVHIYGQVYTSA